MDAVIIPCATVEVVVLEQKVPNSKRQKTKKLQKAKQRTQCFKGQVKQVLLHMCRGDRKAWCLQGFNGSDTVLGSLSHHHLMSKSATRSLSWGKARSGVVVFPRARRNSSMHHPR
jgi:hypothetical protein